jgi:transcriptional regulator with XRE-family HTH domain
MSKPEEHDPDENALYEAVAMRIRAARLRDNLTQQELAERIKAKRSYIFELESGSANPTLRTLYRLGKAFNIAPADLLPEARHPELSHENVRTLTDKCDAILSILTRHSTFGPPSGNRSTMPVSRQTLSRWGPIHCGQSSARTAEATIKPILDGQLRWTDSQFGAINSAFQGAYGISLLGFGWFVDSVEGHKNIGHGGSTSGFSTRCRILSMPSRLHPMAWSRSESWTTQLPSALIPMTGWFGRAASRTR